MSVKLMNWRVKVRALGREPGARDSPQRNQGSTPWLGPFPIVEGESLEELGTGFAEGYQRFFPPFWKVQSDCTMTLKLVFQVVSNNLGLGKWGRERQGLL